MAKLKKKLLPKNFDELLKEGDLEALKAVFDTCDLNARGGYNKQVALAYSECPDEFARWLIDNGADISATDKYGATPLHLRAWHWMGRIDVLLKHGADVQSVDKQGNTPLHDAARVGKVDTARTLLERGARTDAINAAGFTPLVHALQNCDNLKIKGISEIAELLLTAEGRTKRDAPSFLSKILGRTQSGASLATPEMKSMVERIGTNFEFHRASYNPDFLEETSAGLDRLYALFGVPPVPRRSMHDGRSPIIATSPRWEDRHQELWQLLVPSSGAASSVQGEVVRLSGRIGDEIERNGGTNWDADYNQMADAFLVHVGSGVSLPGPALAELRGLVAEVKARRGDTLRLCEFAVDWVRLNPIPIPLSEPNYSR